MKEKINIFLIDGHSLFRKGLKAILSDNPDFVVKGDITSLNEKDVILACQPIDIILIDTDFIKSDLFETINYLKVKKLTKKIVVLTLNKSKLSLINNFRMGIDGYLLKDDEVEELSSKIIRSNAGNFIISDKLMPTIIEMLLEKNDIPIEGLISERELQVLEHIQKGYSNKQISDKLFISENTIKTHIKHIFKKFAVSNRKDAIEKGILWGILK